MQHGLLSDCIVLPGESLEGFQAVLASHFERFMPIDGVERAMIEDMAAAIWRVRRAWSIENTRMAEALDPDSTAGTPSRITAAFRELATSPDFALLHRYETRIHMMYQRAFHNLLLVRNAIPPPNLMDVPAIPNEPNPGEHPLSNSSLRSSPPLTDSASNSPSPAIPNEPSPTFEHPLSNSSPRPSPRLRDSASNSPSPKPRLPPSPPEAEDRDIGE
jgi:hypothetical protein